VLTGLVRRLGRRVLGRSGGARPAPSPEWRAAQAALERATSVVDLGCGGHPHPRARIAVDAFLEPVQRALGHGATLEASAFRRRGVAFVQAHLGALPFADKAFDVAWASHVFEHLPDPRRACAEMQRIARAGVIVTPSAFAEIAFGRRYHLWLVVARGRTLVFVRKTPPEDCPFGDHPLATGDGRYRVSPATNPFDLLLDDGGWYRGRERMRRLSRRLREHWYGHSPVTEVVFAWEGDFDCVVVHEDGRVE
jgi:SAM-dependent methyltransferase